MIVSEYQGNLLNTNCQTIVCTVNTVHAMGKGIALAVKNRWPEVKKEYHRLLHNGSLTVGRSQLVPTNDGHLVLLFVTKQDWRANSQLVWIEEGLRHLVRESAFGEMSAISSIAVPPLGCGNGGLDYWQDVRPLIDYYLEPWWVECTLNIP